MYRDRECPLLCGQMHWEAKSVASRALSVQKNVHCNNCKCGNFSAHWTICACPPKRVLTVNKCANPPALLLLYVLRTRGHKTCTCRKSLMPQRSDSGKSKNNNMMNHCVGIYWQPGPQNGWRTPRSAAQHSLLRACPDWHWPHYGIQITSIRATAVSAVVEFSIVYICLYTYINLYSGCGCVWAACREVCSGALSILNNLLTQSSMANNNKRKWEKCW